MKTLAIVALCVCAAVTYGIIHDQITARICVEYFTIGHPPIFQTDSPTLLGLGWSIIAIRRFVIPPALSFQMLIGPVSGHCDNDENKRIVLVHSPDLGILHKVADDVRRRKFNRTAETFRPPQFVNLQPTVARAQ